MKKSFLSSLILFLGCGVFTMTAKPRTVQIHIIETSDVHGCFFPYDYITRKPKAGTLARVSNYVKQLRKKGDEVVLLDNGDILQGQPVCYFSNFVDTTETNIAARVCNYMKYDAQTIGNHDVETGHHVYDAWKKAMDYPLLGANVVDRRTGKPYLRPYTIIERDGVRIAVIGMLTPAIPSWLGEELWSGLRFDDIVESARKWVAYVKANEHPDLIVGLFHSGKDNGITTAEYSENQSLQVAEEVGGFDIVFFGHDHTRFSGNATNKDGKNVVMLDPANNALSIAQADVTLSLSKGKWKVDSIDGRLVDITDTPVDEDFVAHFKDFTDKVQNYVGRQIGTLTHDIHSRDAFFGPSAFNDLIHNLQLEITGAQISITAPLQFNTKLTRGPIYVSDMFNLCRFENQLYVMRLTGKEIRRHLEMSYDQWVNTMRSPNDHLLLLSNSTRGDQQRLGFKNYTFNFDSAAGIDYIVDVTKPDGEKVEILRMSDGQPFDENKWYKVAVNSYRANGGGELLTRGAGIPRDSLQGRIIWKSQYDLRHYLIDWISRQQEFSPQPGHNWKFVPENWTTEAAKRDSELLFGKK